MIVRSSYGDVTTLEEQAWAGAVLESKGYARHRGGKSGSEIRLTDTRLCLLQRFQEIVGVGSVRERPMPAESKPQWRWNLYSRQAIERLLVDLEPYLSKESLERFTPPKVPSDG